MAKRVKPGSWNKRQRKRFKQQLFEHQNGICANCYCKFAIERLRFRHLTETNTYVLLCVGCHP